MAQTMVRSSSQLYIDADLNHNSKKATALAAGIADTDGVNMGQLNSAVQNIGGAIHAPVADLAAAKAVATDVAPAGHTDRMIMLIETLGLYRYDAQGTDTGNDNTVIIPTDKTTTGRWYKISSVLTDHNNLSGLNVGDYMHLTAVQISALHAQETAATIGAILNGATAETTPLDADLIATTTGGGSLEKISWTTIKAFLKTYFDTLYNLYVHPNHSGDVTSVADGAQTIAANAVTNAKAAQMANSTIKGRVTAGTGNPEDLTVAQVKTLLGLTSLNLSQRYYRQTPTGIVNGSTLQFVIPATILSGTEEVFLNGRLMNAGGATTAVTNDYCVIPATPSAGNTTIEFVIAPLNSSSYTDVILVNYSV